MEQVVYLLSDEKPVLRIRLTVASSGGEQQIRATALNHKKQMFFQAPTEPAAIAGLKSRLVEYEERRLLRAEYPRTIEVEL